MSNRARIVQVTIWEDHALWLAARIQGITGTNITQASISSISMSVFDLHNANAVTYGPTAQTVSSVVFDSLQTLDPRWTADSTGYNVALTVPASAFPLGRAYRVEVKFTPASGDPFFFVANVKANNILSS